jgi:hypothetical protein
MKPLVAVCLIVLTLLGGCHTAKPPLELIILPDMSASIDPESQRQMFAAIKDVALHLHRGDTLTIIPITGDAEAELPGRILRYEVPTIEMRQAYDADLRNLTVKISADLAGLAADAATHPANHTDILGSIRVAMRAFSSRETNKRLVILSDLIQDDQQFNFAKDKRLADPESAISLAMQIGIPRPNPITVYIGRVKSREFSALPISRQHAITTFWKHLAWTSHMHADGISDLRNSF